MDSSNRISKTNKDRPSTDKMEKFKKRGHWSSRKAIEAKRVGGMYYYSRRFSADSLDES